MEILEKKIKEFLKVNINSGYGDGYVYGSGSGYGYGSGNGDGSGYGDGYGDGYGSGSGYGDGKLKIKKINNKKVYQIDNVPTIMLSIHNNIAKGLILNADLTTEKCYIAKGQDKFAHRRNNKRGCTSITRENI